MKPLTVILAALVVGCVSQVRGNLRIDGAPFSPTICYTGARRHFTGVELVDPSGRRLQVSLGPKQFELIHPSAPKQGAPVATIVEPGGSLANSVGACGAMTVGEEDSKVGFRNVEGVADLSCNGGGHSISGHVEFEDCH